MRPRGLAPDRGPSQESKRTREGVGEERYPLLEAEGVHRWFEGGGIRSRRKRRVRVALRGVDLALRAGECLGVVGESGAGKTTLARILTRLLSPSRGRVFFRGQELSALAGAELKAFRSRVQMVFQDPFGSLNPRMRVGQALGEIVRVHEGRSGKLRELERVGEVLGLVGLPAGVVDRFPHELSGGQRQRVAIARALTVGPELLVLDEPVSSLDPSVQAQILGLLRRLREDLGISLLLIAHDLAVVRHLADEVVVMYGGKVVERGAAAGLFERPLHPYTRSLLAAGRTERVLLGAEEVSLLPAAEVSATASEMAGCPFFPRCPSPRKDEECGRTVPDLRRVGRDRELACWKERETGGRG